MDEFTLGKRHIHSVTYVTDLRDTVILQYYQGINTI